MMSTASQATARAMRVGLFVTLLAGVMAVGFGCATRPTPTVQTALEARKVPRVRSFEIGASVEGRPLILHVFGEGPETVFIFGGIHGNEPTSAVLTEDLARLLRRQPALYADRRVAILPQANPDGLVRGTRGNANGVDLNRNFPSVNWEPAPGRPGLHGPRPASEPETRALISVVDRLRPERIVAIHSIRHGRHCNNYDGPAADLASLLSEHNGYRVAPTIGYPTPGSFGSWAGVDRQIPTITLELPREDDTDACWRDNRDALLAFIAGAPTLAE